ncbi:GrpB family protein [Bacillus sp. S10(2024)]|uniref:GrpB family protein n=1 Tax=Bacillus sp. S10(2024) TaxID=3162886 RepID=UPI003D1D1EC6
MRKVEVVPYENHWAEKFQKEAKRLKEAMPEHVKVHHIGSTSVPGLAAKPIIDMIMEVTNIDKVDSWNDIFQKLGYTSKGENGISGRRFYIHGTEEKRSYHLHVYETGNQEIIRHLSFRDYMMVHCEEAEAYATLKQELAKQFSCDIERYIEGKDAFVREREQRAIEWMKKK